MPEITIAEFISRVTPNHICPFCGNRQWAQLGDRGMIVPDEKGEFNLPHVIDRVYMVECGGCGFVRMIRPGNLINRFQEAQKRQQEEQDKQSTEQSTENTEFESKNGNKSKKK